MPPPFGTVRRVNVRAKLTILADAAKYDASCASSGSHRAGNGRGLGSTDRAGICHSYTPDGRCVSLLKILLTNHCIYDCQYCVNRASVDAPRARFTVEEVRSKGTPLIVIVGLPAPVTFAPILLRK